MGRHSLEEVTQKMKQDLDACEALLQSSGAYLSGPTPTPADCFLWALIDFVRASQVLIFLLCPSVETVSCSVPQIAC
jgi:glutathione S-transferase